jgi:hypothetical protein
MSLANWRKGAYIGSGTNIDYRWAMGKPERVRTLATELVNLALDALLAVSTPALAALQKATHTIPIVFVAAMTGVTTEMFYRAVEAVAPQFAVEMIRSDVHSLEDIETDMKSLATDGSAGLIFPPEPFTLQNSKAIVIE